MKRSYFTMAVMLNRWITWASLTSSGMPVTSQMMTRESGELRAEVLHPSDQGRSGRLFVTSRTIHSVWTVKQIEQIEETERPM